MQNVKEKYPFFKKFEKLSIILAQDEGKKTKLFLDADGEGFTVVCGEREENRLLFNNLNFLSRNLGEEILLPKVHAADKSLDWFIMDYVGGQNAKSLFMIKADGEKIDTDKLADELYNLAHAIHNIPVHKQQNNWRETITSEIEGYFQFFDEIGAIGDECFDRIRVLMNKLDSYFKQVIPRYIHDDFTAKNVCFDPCANKLFLVDFDTIKIGDPNIDISKSITHSFGSDIFLRAQEKFYPNFDKDVCYFYGVRVSLFWLKSLHDRKLPEFSQRILEFKERISGWEPSGANK